MEGKLADVNELEIQSSISRFTELHFYSGRDEWNDDMIDIQRKLAQRINIKVEESQGLEMCTISLHNMIHVHEDIMNFSATDNYWCAVIERALKDCEMVTKLQRCRSNICQGRGL